MNGVARPRALRIEPRVLAIGLAVLGGFAAVPGDIGGCGQGADELDPVVFFQRVRAIQCEQCTRCAVQSLPCREACAAAEPPPTAFEAGCVPLVHDGEVCLRALEAASCRAFRTYVDERAPRQPSECDFCPPRGAQP